MTTPAQGFNQVPLGALSSQQQRGLKDWLQQLGSYQSQATDVLGSQASGKFNANSPFGVEQMSHYTQHILPQILQAYGGFGAGSGSGLNTALAHSATDLGERFASRQSDIQQQSLMSILGLNEKLLQQPTSQYQAQGPSILHKFIEYGLPILGAALGSTAGPAGTAAGTVGGHALAKLLDRLL